MTARRRVFHTVLKEDPQHLLDGYRISEHLRRIILQQRDLVCLIHDLRLARHILNELLQVQPLLMEYLPFLVRPREEQQLLDKLLHVLCL